MLLYKKIDRLTELMKNGGIDVLIVGPSADLEYLTGLHPLMDERFKALFVFSDKRHFYIAPELYYEETREALGEDMDIFKWSDGKGFIPAILKANKKYGLEGKKIGINDGIRAVDMIDVSNEIDVKFINGVSIMENLKIIKDEEEKNNLRKAANIADKAFENVLKFVKPGITEGDIKDKLEELMAEYGGEGLAFQTIIASGPNSARPHYNDYDRVIQDRDVIIMDFGCRYHGYCSDESRTVFVGEPTEEQKKIYSIVLEANEKGENVVKEGIKAGDVDRASRDIIKDAGYGEYFINRTGHGIGTADHEAPYISEGNKQVLKNGMAFSVEPGIYIAGKFGMRVEDIVLLNEGKGEILNKVTKDMIIIK
ncbi:M24 family metallopeptidase [Clostridium sp. MT-14]|jgi:Xaa-Pro dipeptidase|uniref:M24 family metallopeptidase n=1 Tax=Clostridium sp. MT-14 TaxID=3348360 RepID=UPI0035F3E9AD